jgi:hypothetical protein
VRGEQASGTDEVLATPKLKLTRRKAIVASAVMITAIIGAIALKKSHHDAPAETTATTSPDAHATPPTAVAAENTPPPALPPPIPAPTAPPMDPGASFGLPTGVSGGLASADDDTDAPTKGSHKHHGKVTPFGNGPVHHGNVLHLKMDGPIESIEGAQQPTGFAVKLPGRKSLEAAGPLAARDSRIAAIKVSNDPAGAELTIAFKDGVPNYRVDSKGDTLIISLAPAGSLDKTVAKNDAKGGKAAKHFKHDHKKAEKH